MKLDLPDEAFIGRLFMQLARANEHRAHQFLIFTAIVLGLLILIGISTSILDGGPGIQFAAFAVAIALVLFGMGLGKWFDGAKLKACAWWGVIVGILLIIMPVPVLNNLLAGTVSSLLASSLGFICFIIAIWPVKKSQK